MHTVADAQHVKKWIFRFREPRAINALRARRYIRSENGVAAVEFALVLPLLVTLLFGSIDLGFVLSDTTKLRAVNREVARRATVGQAGFLECPGNFQTTANAGPTGAARSTASEHIVCLARFYGADAGLDVRTAVRVVKYVNGVLQTTGTNLPFERGNSIVVCMQMHSKSRSGFMSSVFDDRVFKTKVDMLIPEDIAAGAGEFADAPFDTTNGWNACDE
jgi:Flp pilus assembly pilin Flp